MLLGLVLAIVLLGSFVQGLTGFGLALVSVPLLSLVVGVKTAIPLAGLFGWLVTFPIAWRMRHAIRWETSLTLLVASLPGSWLGAELLSRLPGEAILLAMGVILVLSSLLALLRHGPLLARTYRPATVVAGFLSGSLGGAVGEPGPPVIAYFSLLPWQADETKATLVSFFMLQMIGALASFYKKGLITADVMQLFASSLPSFIIGVAMGMWGYALLQKYRIDYHKIVHVALLAVGVSLVFKSI